MSDGRKVQIWLRPDQVDLLRSLLEANHTGLEGGGINRLERVLLWFCARRISELLQLLPPANAPAQSVEIIPRRKVAGQ